MAQINWQCQYWMCSLILLGVGVWGILVSCLERPLQTPSLIWNLMICNLGGAQNSFFCDRQSYKHIHYRQLLVYRGDKVWIWTTSQVCFSLNTTTILFCVSPTSQIVLKYLFTYRSFQTENEIWHEWQYAIPLNGK